MNLFIPNYGHHRVASASCLQTGFFSLSFLSLWCNYDMQCIVAVNDDAGDIYSSVHILTAPTVGDSTRISDLDDWVDQVFDPIIHRGSVDSLIDSKTVHRSLKGNGSKLSVRVLPY